MYIYIDLKNYDGIFIKLKRYLIWFNSIIDKTKQILSKKGWVNKSLKWKNYIYLLPKANKKQDKKFHY